MKSKLISVLVAFALLFSWLPFHSYRTNLAFAENVAAPDIPEENEGGGQLNTGAGSDGVEGGELPQSPSPPALLFVGAPVADAEEIAVGQQVIWRFAMEGAEHAAYRVESAGQSIAEGTLPGGAAEFAWIPEAAGEYILTVTAFLGEEQVSESSAVLAVVSAPEPLTSEVLTNAQACVQGDTVVVAARAAGGMAPYQFALTASLAGTVVAFGEGELSFTAQAPGSYEIALLVTDASGATANAAWTIQCKLDLPEDLRPDFELTGDVASDMVAVAYSQIGYAAGEGGLEGYTRFGDWYDRTYNGSAGSEALLFGDWRASFISYCAAFAGVSDSILPHSETVAGWMDQIPALALPLDHVPAAGDVAFIAGDRVGVVVSVSEGVIALVEGDVNGMVAESLCDDGEILGYAPVAGVARPREDNETPANPEDLELLLVTFAQESQALVTSSVTPDANLITLGQPILWTVEAAGGEGELSYQYRLMMDGEPLGELGEAVSENTFAYTPESVGTYVLRVTVADEAETVVSSESSPVNVTDGDPLARAGDGWDALSRTAIHQGGTIFSGTIPSESQEDEPVFGIFALLEELEIAYLECSSPLMTLGQPVTWTVQAAGGDGNYRYQMGLYYQEFSDTSNIYTLVAAKNYSQSPTFTYTPTMAGRYFINVFIKDTADKAVYWQSQVFMTANAVDVNLTTTVAGKVNWIVQNYIRSGMSDVEKARVLHNWLIANADYDYGSDPYYHADGVLLYGKGVCQSYAQAYVYLCTAAGIPCIYVTGYAGGGSHGWNIVNIDNAWWHVDCTWDDPGGSSPRYDYFMKTDAEMRSDHSWDEDWTHGSIDGLYPTSNITVKSVTFDVSSISMPLGESRTVIATIAPANATNPTLTWTSSKPGIASVNNMGEITAITVGSTVITAKSTNGKYGTVAVTVYDPKIVTGIKFVSLPTVWEVTAEETLDLAEYVDIAPDTALRDMRFAVTSGAIYAGITGEGIVVPKKVGTAAFTVTALSGNKSATASIRFVDSYAPTSIAIEQGMSQTMEMRDTPTLQLTAIASPAGKKTQTVWTSSAPGVATIDSTGVVRAIRSGATTITATSQNGKIATLRLTVTDKYEPLGITLVDGSSILLNLYDPEDASKTPLRHTLQTKLTPETAQAELTWTSSVATVAAFENGELVAKKVGSTVVTVRTHNGKAASATVNIIDPKVPFGIRIGPDDLEKPVRLSLESEGLQLEGILTPGTAETVETWKSTAPLVATVTNGLVKPLKAGTTTITVQTANLKTASLAVTVYDPNAVTAIVFSQSLIQWDLSSNDTLDLKEYVQVTPVTASTNLTFAMTSMLYSTYASVSADGIVTPQKAGTFYVKVTSSNGNKTATVQVRILNR